MWGQAVSLQHIGAQGSHGDQQPNGRWIGMIRVKGIGRDWLIDAIGELKNRADFYELGVPDLLNYLIAADHDVRVWYIHGHWLDVNSLADLELAGNFAAEQDS